MRTTFTDPPRTGHQIWSTGNSGCLHLTGCSRRTSPTSAWPGAFAYKVGTQTELAGALPPDSRLPLLSGANPATVAGI